jgi:hypothetical protein
LLLAENRRLRDQVAELKAEPPASSPRQGCC